MSTIIQDICIGLADLDKEVSKENRGIQLENSLTTICRELGNVGTITEGKGDVELLLSIVGSYILSKDLPKDSKPPSELFEERLFPMIDNMEDVIEGEIEDDT